MAKGDPVAMLWSISKLAAAFDLDRRTVAKRIHNTKPAGVERGSPVYRLKDAAAALFGSTTAAGDQVVNPNKLDPGERLAWYRSERERLSFEAEIGQLVPEADHRAELAKLAKAVLLQLETLPDVLERDCGLAPRQVALVQTKVDEARDALAEAVLAADEDGDDDLEGV